MTYIASTGRKHLYLKELHEQYGEAVRIGKQYSNVVSLLTLLTARAIQALTQYRYLVLKEYKQSSAHKE